MRSLPGGFVTFVFTDIEGSTRLFRRLGAEYRSMLDTHRRLLRAAWAAHGGVEVGTEGDSFFVAFDSPSEAVAACLEGQLALAGHPWPQDAAIRVRFGVHSGDADPVGNDYVALAVHQAARVSATGHGGQVVVSDATRAAVGDRLPPGASLLALGEYQLKDFDEPQRLHQLAHPGLGASFPALRAMPAAGHNLPLARTPCVGRGNDIALVADLMAQAPLVTITGPGGVGKTRLALEVALQTLPAFPDGVWFVDLSSVRDGRSVAAAAAAALGVREEPGRPLADTLVDALRAKRALLVLDNCEHVVDATATVVEQLLTTPGLAVLATSREALSVRGERVWAVAPLEWRDAQSLFVDRGAAAQRDFAPDDAVMATIASICDTLDCLPLAIELAAARTTALTPGQILTRLEKRLPLLAGGARDAPSRQRTLHATIEWSFELLPPQEQCLFRRLAVFQGGCTLEAAEDVTGADVDGLQSLIAKSLVVAADGRFSMLETIREFALEALDASGEEADVRSRHARYFASRAPHLGWRARGSELDALHEIAAEYDNARAAFDWALAADHIEMAAAFVEGLWYHWIRRGSTAEGYRLASAVLARATAPGPELVSITGELARFSGKLEEAVRLKERSLDGYLAAGGPAKRIAATHTDLAGTLIKLGRLDEAAEHAARGVEIRREVGDPYGVAHAESALVQLALAQGHWVLAAEIAERSMTTFEELRAWSDLAWASVDAAEGRTRSGDLVRARAHLRTAFRCAADIDEVSLAVAIVERTAALAARVGDADTALLLAGAARAGRRTAGYVFGDEQAASTITGEQPDPARRAALLDEGATWDMRDATAKAADYLG